MRLQTHMHSQRGLISSEGIWKDHSVLHGFHTRWKDSLMTEGTYKVFHMTAVMYGQAICQSSHYIPQTHSWALTIWLPRVPSLRVLPWPESAEVGLSMTHAPLCIHAHTYVHSNTCNGDAQPVVCELWKGWGFHESGDIIAFWHSSIAAHLEGQQPFACVHLVHTRSATGPAVPEHVFVHDCDAGHKPDTNNMYT